MVRMRSPNFPALPLEEAINIVAGLYSKVRKMTIEREVAAKELGYSGLTGRSLKVLGALNQYGLIDNVQKGKCHVTELAEQALHGFPEAEKIGAIQRAAREPGLFRAIFEEFGEQVQSEHAIRAFLLKRGFTDKGVESALQSFLATQKFAGFDGKEVQTTESVKQELPLSTESGRPDAEDNLQSYQVAGTRDVVASPPSKPIFRDQPLEFSLSSKGLAVTGGTNSRSELQAFIEKLVALSALLPDDSGDS